MHVLYVIFVIKRSWWCPHEFGAEHEREEIQGHHFTPANTARAADQEPTEVHWGLAALLVLDGSGRIRRFFLNFFDFGNFGRLAVTAV